MSSMRLYRIYYSLIKQVMKRFGRWNYNDYSSAHAVGFISAFQIMNAFYLIENILFTDARGCGACNGKGRLTALGFSMLVIYTLNNIVFWKERPDVFAPLSQMKKRVITLLVTIYVACSIYLVG